MSFPASTARALLLAAGLSALAAAAEPGMVFIPGGEFVRGRTHEHPDAAFPYYPNPLRDDRPIQNITVSPFYLDQTEVTNERYAAFVKATGHKPPYHWVKGQFAAGQEKHPVNNVSWDDAVAFCEYESKRLPTEAEWERACRGQAEGLMTPWGNDEVTAKQAHFGAQNPDTVCGSRERNYYGLCDMIGNVWEWTADWYAQKYYEVSPTRDPKGPDSGKYRVLRGGSWFDQTGSLQFLTCSYRSWSRPAERSPTIGFRCAKSFPSVPVRR